MNKGKVALITGSSRGIGREIALHLGQKGYDIVVNFNKSEAKANEVLAQLKLLPIKSMAVRADVGNPDEVYELRKRVEQEFGKLDLLINNAGIIVRPASWNEITNEDMLSTVKVNLLAPMYTIKEFTPLLEKSESGNIINIASTYAYKGSSAVLAYTASKAGVMSLTKAMALELSKFNIRVNAIAPGNFETEMTTSSGQGVIDWVISTTPLKRLGQPKEISHCIDFLLDAGFITGIVLNIDGGQLLSI